MDVRLINALVCVLAPNVDSSAEVLPVEDLGLLYAFTLQRRSEILDEAIERGLASDGDVFWVELKSRLERLLPEELVRQLESVEPVRYPLGCVEPKD